MSLKEGWGLALRVGLERVGFGALNVSFVLTDPFRTLTTGTSTVLKQSTDSLTLFPGLKEAETRLGSKILRPCTGQRPKKASISVYIGRKSEKWLGKAALERCKAWDCRDGHLGLELI